MHKHYCNGPRVVKWARHKRAAEPMDRMQSLMVWMTYAAMVAWGLFLRAVGWL